MGQSSQKQLQVRKEQVPTLCVALGALREGNSKAFEDTLWLGLGERWTGLRDLLVENGYVLRNSREDGYRLADSGLVFMRSLCSCA